MELTKPTIHLNGTSAEELFVQVCTVLEALRATRGAMALATPNGRDYYPQGDHVFHQAITEHEIRMVKLGEILAEYEALAEHIADERDAREARRTTR